MEDKIPLHCCLCRMKNRPPLAIEETLGCLQNQKKTYTTESSTSGAITYGPPSKIDPPKSSFPMTIKLDIISLLAGESDTVETKALRISLPKDIEYNFPKS